MRMFVCDSCTVYGINMSTTATIEKGKCQMSPPCDNVRCQYYDTKKGKDMK